MNTFLFRSRFLLAVFSLLVSINLYSADDVTTQAPAELSLSKKTLAESVDYLQQLDIDHINKLETEDLYQSFLKTNSVWKSLANSTFELFKLDQVFRFSFPNADSDDEIKRHLEMLPKLSKARAKILQELILRDDYRVLSFSRNYFGTIFLEIKTVPYRWYSIFYFGYIKLKNDFQGTTGSFADFLGQVLSLCLLFLLYCLSWKYYPKLDQFLLRERQVLIKKAYREIKARRAVLWIDRLRPFVPWVIILLICKISSHFLVLSYFPELETFIPYVSIYAYFRIFKLALAVALSKLSLLSGVERNKDLKIKIEKSTKWIGQSIFYSMLCLHAIQSSLSHGLLHYEVARFTQIVVLLILLLVVNKWKQEIANLVEEESSTKLGSRIASECRGPRSLIFAPIGAFIAAVILFGEFIFEWMQSFTFGKRLAALVFKKQISILKTDQNYDANNRVPENYRSEFLKPKYIDVPGLFKKEIQLVEQNLNSWGQSGSMGNSLAIIGDIGIGKSFFTQKLSEVFNKDFDVQQITIDQKILNAAEMEKMLPLDAKGSSNVDSPNRKLVLIIDEAENLFLSKVGGFEAIKKCFEILSNERNDIFWILNFNTQAWVYLNSALKKDHLFNKVIELPNWTEEQIQILIEARHQQTNGFSISFDEILSATRGDASYEMDEQIEEKFFHLLTEESKGNPSCAIQIWPSCLRKTVTENLLIVGLPQERSGYQIQSLNDTCFFILASILKHGELKLENIVEATEFTEDAIGSSIKQILSKGLILRKENANFCIHPLWLHKIETFLEGKNFIYGN